MKLLLLHCKEYWFTQPKKEKVMLQNVVVTLLHAEKEDETKKHVAAHAADQIVWLCRKTSVTMVMLHSFAHLSDSKSSLVFATKVVESIKEILEHKKYTVHTTPHTSLEFMLHVSPEPIAKMWKSV